MKYLLVFFILFLVSCSNSGDIIAKDSLDNFEKDDFELVDFDDKKSCDFVVCNNNFVCEDGECVCNGRICNGFCVLDGCCKDSDCDSNMRCLNFECVKFSFCRFGEFFDEAENKCVCERDYFYCKEQKRCIKKGFCCSVDDCGRFESCSNTYFSVNLCFQYFSKKKCSVFRENIEFSADTPEGDLLVLVENIFSDGLVKLKINDITYDVFVDERFSISEGTFWVESFQEIGGVCRVKYD
jgi:hypothetical protein